MKLTKSSRRQFLKQGGQITMGISLLGLSACSNGGNTSTTADQNADDSKTSGKMFFNISLAQWSLHKAIRGGLMTTLDFAPKAHSLGISAIEYVNQLFMDKAEDAKYLKELNKRASDNGVQQLLIMVDNEGDLGNTDQAAREKAVENHYKWVTAAHALGCHSVRVNAAGTGSREEVAKAASEGLAKLAEFAAQENMNVIVENHGGYSSDALWLGEVLAATKMLNCGALPDFGNFCIEKDENGECVNSYDRYKGVRELMPYAKGVSAKSYDFNESGEETSIDFRKMLGIVKDSGFKGFIGVEYEGDRLSEEEGIKATKALLEKVGAELSES